MHSTLEFSCEIVYEKWIWQDISIIQGQRPTID